MAESLQMIEKGLLRPASVITHIGGLNSVVQTTMNLPKIPEGKKLIYTNIKMEPTSIAEFREKGKTSPLFLELADITERNNGLWSSEAEKLLLSKAEPI